MLLTLADMVENVDGTHSNSFLDGGLRLFAPNPSSSLAISKLERKEDAPLRRI